MRFCKISCSSRQVSICPLKFGNLTRLREFNFIEKEPFLTIIAFLHKSFRSRTFAAMIKQECGWFDEEHHSSGELSARLTGDASSLQNVRLYVLIPMKNVQKCI